MKELVKAFIKFLLKKLSQRDAQEVLLDCAEDLAKKTGTQWDNKLVAFFRHVWEKTNEE